MWGRLSYWWLGFGKGLREGGGELIIGVVGIAVVVVMLLMVGC